ncbi:CCA tRNA nucleotidyltransferase [Terriglobus albidus]|uniref:CCA tRNA nucleotidyltransferase n=1 Tax=Terriglobus albidus TaxID=1592106 RepID=A0A5B9EBJ3_9BACT|nr:CCA tRNA nucleotidyltransferase [Terriglobus albidus]QEE29074.1 CCA tRNA nucleotidyltransferase [Terriglobus albidus]
MADYIYLLENRLSANQKDALEKIKAVVRERGMTLFLVGGAVRDLTAGTSVRDLDVAVQGNALKLKKDIQKAGGTFSGEYEPTQSLFFDFPGSVRVEISSTLGVTYPKPAKPVYKPANILEDLRRRDFTANAMALSLNEGSWGLLMDPLNGVADIENRELRLVSNYGFIEDPSRLVRAARLSSRLGWQLEERTRARYETAKEEDYIANLPAWYRGYELEEIAYEEDGLRVLRHLENEGWMKALMPAWGPKVVNATALDDLRDKVGVLQLQGIFPDASAIAFPLLTAKLTPKDVATLKHGFPRQAFVEAIDGMEAQGKALATEFTGKSAAAPSAAWKLLHAAKPEAVLQMVFAVKSGSVQNKFKAFTAEWPQARLKIPYALMLEMRITPDLPGYDELVEKLFFELMDGKLSTVEEMKAYLEPYSPPAPPPPVNLRRPRAAKKESKRAKKAAPIVEEVADELIASGDAGIEIGDEDLIDAEAALEPVKAAPAKKAAPAEVKAAEHAPAKKAAAAPAPPKKPAAAPAAPAKKAAPAPPVKAAAKKPAPLPAKKAPAKPEVRKPAPAPAKKAAVPAKKTAPVKHAAGAKKPAPPAKKTVPAKKPVAHKPAKPAAKPAKKAAAKKAPAKKR